MTRSSIVGSVVFAIVMGSCLGALAELSSLSYVQEGIVAQWDAIENAGRGSHNAEATTWVDLSGHNHTLSSFADGYSWSANAFVFPTAAYGLCGVFTDAVAVEGTDYASYDLAYTEEFRAGAAFFLFGFGGFKGISIRPDADHNSIETENKNAWSLSGELVTSNEMHTVYADYGTPSSMSATSCMFDGTALVRKSSTASWTQTTPGLGYYNNSNWSFHGGLHALRLYNRSLTAGEVGLNRAIDLVRFDGKSTAEVALPAGYSWNGTGTGVVLSDAVSFGIDSEGALAGGLIAADDETPTASGSVTKEVNATTTLQAIPAQGYYFGRWTGDTSAIVEGDIYSTQIVVASARPIQLNALFDDPANAAFARIANGAFSYFTSFMNPATPPAGGMNDDVTILFSSDAEYQQLAAVSNEVVKAKGLELEADVTLAADADWRTFDFSLAGHGIDVAGNRLTLDRIPAGEGCIDSSGEILANRGFDLDPIDNGAKVTMVPQRWTTSGSVSLILNNSSYGNHQKTGSNRCYVPSGKWIQQEFTISQPGTFKLKVPYANYNYGNTYVTGKIYCNMDGVRLDTYSTGGWGNKTFEISGIQLVSGSHTIRIGCSSGTGVHFDSISFKREDVTVSGGGVLEFNVPEGKTLENSTLTIGGGDSMQVWKTGGGKLTMSKVNDGFGKTEAAVVVKEGVMDKSGNGATCGGQYAIIQVDDGGAFDIKGRTYSYYHYILNGDGPDGKGALINTASTSSPWTKGSYGYLYNVNLGSDTTISGTKAFGMIYWNYGANTMTMNGHTVHYGGTTIYLGNMSYVGEGRIVIDAGGSVQAYSSDPSAPDCTVVVDGQLDQHDHALTPVSNLVFNATGKFRNAYDTRPAITVLDTYAPNLLAASDSKAKHPTVILGTEESLATTLDLSRHTEVFDASSTTFAENSQVTVQIGSRRPTGEMQLIDWTDLPPDASVTFNIVADGSLRGTVQERRSGGLYLIKLGFSITIR